MEYKFKNMKDIRNYFTDRGFKEFNPPNLRSYDGVATMFQKKYIDEIGVKYFIDIKIWDWTYTDRVPENYSVEFEGQYYKKGNHNAMNITFIDWKLEEVEEWLDKMFEAGMLEHYEK